MTIPPELPEEPNPFAAPPEGSVPIPPPPPMPDGYVDHLTWQSRRIHLVPEGDPPVVRRVSLVQNLRQPDQRRGGLTMSSPQAYSPRSMFNQTLSRTLALRSDVSSLALVIGLILIVLTGGGPV